jgi:hypothetical protein
MDSFSPDDARAQQSFAAIRTLRYIRYSDGTEELYDHQKDDLEWDNLANDPKYTEIKKQFANGCQ